MPPTPVPPASPSSNPHGRRPAAAENAADNRRPPPFKVCVLGIGQMGLVCAAILAAHVPVPSAAGRAIPAERPERDGRSRRATAPGTPPARRKPAASGQSGADRPGEAAHGRSNVAVVLWGHSLDEAGALTQTRRSRRLDGLVLPESVRVTSDLKMAVADADLVVSAVPVQFKREVWGRLRKKLPRKIGVVSVAKGIENGTLLRPTQLIAEALGDDPDARPRPLGVLSGPTIAPELARGLPASMVAASEDAEFSAQIQRLFTTQFLRIYTHDDVLGVEVAGATKNVVAIAAGVLDGLRAGNNAKSALLARGLAEITRLGAAMGARADTFFGLAGVGDLATSCFSPEGRNRSLGEALGRGQKLDDYLRSTNSVVEGVATTRSVIDLAAKFRVEMPIAQSVHSVLFEGVDPIDGIGRLMQRQPKPESVR